MFNQPVGYLALPQLHVSGVQVYLKKSLPNFGLCIKEKLILFHNSQESSVSVLPFLLQQDLF